MSGGNGQGAGGGRPKGKPTASPLGATMGVSTGALSTSGVEATTKRPNTSPGLGGKTTDGGPKATSVAAPAVSAAVVTPPTPGVSGASSGGTASDQIAQAKESITGAITAKIRPRKPARGGGLSNVKLGGVTLG